MLSKNCLAIPGAFFYRLPLPQTLIVPRTNFVEHTVPENRVDIYVHTYICPATAAVYYVKFNLADFAIITAHPFWTAASSFKESIKLRVLLCEKAS